MSQRQLADFKPGEILRTLEAHHVRYVVIGATAAIAAGAPILTTDLDVTPQRSPDYIERLASALCDLDAKLRTRRRSNRNVVSDRRALAEATKTPATGPRAWTAPDGLVPGGRLSVKPR